MVLRQLGKIAFGGTTPWQLVLSCIVGTILGLLPGFGVAPGSHLLLLAVLALLPLNLWLAALMALGAELLGARDSVVTGAGALLLEGPTEGLFRWIVSAPGLAWCGFDYHQVAGAWLVGAGIGALGGLGLVRLVSRLRTALLTLDEDSPRFRAITGSRAIRAVTWLLLGAAPRRATLERFGERRAGLPIRPLGAVGLAGVVIIIWALPGLFASPVLTAAIRGGLERLNGATVDLDRIRLDLASGVVEMEGLAVADRADLGRDLIRVRQARADLDLRALLRRRWQIEELRMDGAEMGLRRAQPGRALVGAGEPPPPPREPPPAPRPDLEEIPLSELLVEAERWAERLRQGEELLRRLSRPGPGSDDEASPAREAPPRLRGSLTRARGLRSDSPLVRIDRLVIGGIEADSLVGSSLEIQGWNLSSAPSLLPERPGLSCDSADGSLRVAVNPRELPSATAGAERLLLRRTGIDGDGVARKVRWKGEPLLSGGEIDIEIEGEFRLVDDALLFELAGEVRLRDVSVRLPGSDRLEPLERLTLPFTVASPLTAPQIRLAPEALIDALTEAGRGELARRARAELDGRLEAEQDRLTERLEEKLGEQVGEQLGDAVGDEAKRVLERIGGGLFGGDDR